MSEWKEVTLGDYIDIKHGFAFKGDGITTCETDAILVTPGNFHIGGGFKTSKYKYFDNNYPQDYVFKEGDIIVTMTDLSKEGDTLGYGAKVPKIKGKVLLHNQRIGLVQFTQENGSLDKNYLHWLLRTYDYHAFVLGAATGTSVRHTSPKTIKQYSFLLPPLPEQKSIASVLSSLDDKIDLLHRQNKTLEAMAETLFRQWFVEKAEEDWETGTLGNEFDFTMGQSPPGSSFNDEGIGIPMFQGNADFGFRFPQERIYTTEPKRLAKPFDTLISVRAPVGAQNMAKEECCIGRGLAAFRYKRDAGFYTYTYFKIRSLIDEILTFNDEGTVFGSISKSDFQSIKVLLPPKQLIQKYESNAKPMNDKVILNCKQIQKLENTRDLLSPQLIGGQLKIKLGGINHA